MKDEDPTAFTEDMDVSQEVAIAFVKQNDKVDFEKCLSIFDGMTKKTLNSIQINE